MKYLKTISYIFVILYLGFTICKFYCWWEGYTFPITFNSNRLQNFWGKLFYLPILSSLFILGNLLFNKMYIVLKISALMILILFNLILFMSDELTTQWYDVGDWEDGSKSQILHNLNIEKDHLFPLNHRVVKKTTFLKMFCWVDVNKSFQSPYIMGINVPDGINLDD